MPLRVSSWRENPTPKAVDHSATDEQLIVQVGRGDIRAFESLVARYQKQALRAAQRFVGDRQEAEDLAQEAFLIIYRRAAQYEPKASFKTWFFTILLNLCRNATKKKKPVYSGDSLPDLTAPDDPASQFESSELRRALTEAILNLPENQRSAFILCHYENFSYAEIAESLGVSVKAVESLLVRAKRNLREDLSWLKNRYPGR